jgi:hypothetical protein
MVTIEEFLAIFPKVNTKKVYQVSLKHFFGVVKIPPSEYFNNGRMYEKNVVDFLNLNAKKLHIIGHGKAITPS